MNRSYPSSVVLAAGQIQSRLLNEAPATLESIEALINQAAGHDVDLLVLPECAYPAYLLGSVSSYRTGDHLTSEQFIEWLGQRAARHKLHIVSGYVEDTGDDLFNAAILLGPNGQVIGGARKRFLWHVDQDWFRPGEEIRVFETQVGRVGILICAETRVPEIIATLAADGAELIAMPTCWINTSREPGTYYNVQTDFLVEARTREFGIPFVCADKSGLELTMGYVGQSCVATPQGGMVVKAPAAGEALVVGEVQLRPAPRVWVSASRRKRLLDPASPALPARSSSHELTVAAASTMFAEGNLGGKMGEALFAPLQKQNVHLLAVNMPHEATAEQVTMLARAFDMEAVAFPTRADVFSVNGVRTGCMAGQWLQSFATGRALALEGAELLVYFDTAADLPMLRTRALENRVFVIGVDADWSVIVGPDGAVLARGDANAPAITTIDIAAASDKQVAPRTDIFAQRRPGMYKF